MRRPYTRFKIGERFHVKGFIPPEKMVEIADERTLGMQCAFIHLGGRAQDVGTFARSCYMQGVNDAADALARVGVLQVKDTK